MPRKDSNATQEFVASLRNGGRIKGEDLATQVGPDPLSSSAIKRSRKAVEKRIAQFTAAGTGGVTNVLINCRDDR